MAFKPNVSAAARRTIGAADALNSGITRGVAGYLYGIAAECAIKSIMASSGVRINGAFYAHFPELRSILRDELRGRRSSTLARFIEDDSFMNNWHVSMRYAKGADIQDHWVDAWAEQARGAVSAIDA